MLPEWERDPGMFSLWQQASGANVCGGSEVGALQGHQ